MQETLPAPSVLTEERSKPRVVPMWKVIFHNDDVTTMDFVVKALIRYFGHTTPRAQEVMLTIHRTGVGIAGTFPLEVAELKADQTISAARPWFPLQVTLETAD